MRNSILDMINYIEDALIHFDNLDIVETVENVLVNGTEHDLQLKFLNKYSMDDLKIYLMDNVDYHL